MSQGLINYKKSKDTTEYNLMLEHLAKNYNEENWDKEPVVKRIYPFSNENIDDTYKI